MARHEDGENPGREGSWAIIRIGGKQHRVRSGDRLDVARSDYIAAMLPDAEGRRYFTFDDILIFHSPDGKTIVGAPTVPNARVVAELLSEKRDRKVVAFKKRRRQNSRRRRGHRQWLQPLVVVSVESDGLAPGILAPDRASPAGQRVVPMSSPDAVAKILSSLRGEDSSTRLAALGEIASWSGSGIPSWACVEMAKAVEPLLLKGHDRQRSVAALALCVLSGGPSGEDATSEMVAEALTRHFHRTGRRHVLDVELRVQARPPAGPADSERYQAMVRLRHRLNLPYANLDVRLGDQLPKAAHLDLTVSGLGVYPNSVRITPRREKPHGTSYEAVVEFDNDLSSATVAVLDIVVDGRRIERRFLSLDDFSITRGPPERVSRDATLEVREGAPIAVAL